MPKVVYQPPRFRIEPDARSNVRKKAEEQAYRSALEKLTDDESLRRALWDEHYKKRTPESKAPLGESSCECKSSKEMRAENRPFIYIPRWMGYDKNPVIGMRESLWKGKTIITDLDGTLIDSRKLLPDQEPESGSRIGQRKIVKIKSRSREYQIEITKINLEALDWFLEISSHEARVVIASAAAEQFVEKATATTSISELVDLMFGHESLDEVVWKRKRVSPKDLSVVIEAIGEANPLANCVMIGDNTFSDVPASPEGLVTVIGPMESLYNWGIDKIADMILVGRGDIAKGFDLIYEAGGGDGGYIGKVRNSRDLARYALIFDKRLQQGPEGIGNGRLIKTDAWPYYDVEHTRNWAFYDGDMSRMPEKRPARIFYLGDGKDLPSAIREASEKE